MVIAGTKTFLESLPKAFSSFKYSEVCHIFNISPEKDPPPEVVFPKFVCKRVKIDEDYVAQEVLQHLIADLEILNDTTTGMALSDEATRSFYVTSFLIAAVYYFKDDIILRPQKNLKGRYGHGPVDFGLESRHTCATVSVTEIKKDDLKKGIAQNMVQLEACLTGCKRKWSDDRENAYGIVTDAKDWYFLHCVSKNQQTILFELSDPVTINWTAHNYFDDIKRVLEHILWLLVKMGEAEAKTGAIWINNVKNFEEVSDDPIYFYAKGSPYYKFTNFYEGNPIIVDGNEWPTSEHLFQSKKFPNNPKLVEEIRQASTPRKAFELAHRHSTEVCTNWDEIKMQAMNEVLKLKFDQDKKLSEMLLETGNRILVEDSLGERNELGRALMNLRNSLRER